MCYCFFTRMKQPHTLPTICNNPCTRTTFKAGSQQLLATQMANTLTNTVDRDTEQLFSDQWTSYHVSYVFLLMCKRLSTLNFDFQEM